MSGLPRPGTTAPAPPTSTDLFGQDVYFELSDHPYPIWSRFDAVYHAEVPWHGGVLSHHGLKATLHGEEVFEGQKLPGAALGRNGEKDLFGSGGENILGRTVLDPLAK